MKKVDQEVKNQSKRNKRAWYKDRNGAETHEWTLGLHSPGSDDDSGPEQEATWVLDKFHRGPKSWTQGRCLPDC